MTAPAPQPGRRPRRALRRAVGALAVLVVLAVVAVVGIGWYFSGVALAVDHSPYFPYTVRASAAGTVRVDAAADARVPGRYGLSWAGGHAEVGPVVAQDASGVVRPVTSGAAPAPGTKVWVDPFYYSGDPRTALGLDYSVVTVDGPLGALPAWLVPAGTSGTSGTRSGTTSGAATGTDPWVVFVHGHDSTREEWLRYLRTWHDLGLTTLVPTYRNDVGAPASPDGHSHLGATEWQDAAAAVRYATAHGARDVVLAGWSMGGAVSLQALQDPAVAKAVRGVVMDSPVLDWRDTFRRQGSDRGLPTWLTGVAEQLVELRAGLDLDRFDWPARARDLTVPVLLFHSEADDFVPDGPSRALARERPDLVTFVDVPGARHTRAWNVDPDAYDTAMTGWLERTGVVTATAAG